MRFAVALRVLIVMGCLAALLASAQQEHKPTWSTRTLPPLRAREQLTLSKPLDKIAIALVPNDYAAWIVHVDNLRDEQVSLLWDESSFIGANRVSYGRLIRGETKRINTDRTQPPSPIAAHTRLVEYVIPEALADFKPRVVRVQDSVEPLPQPTNRPPRDIDAEQKECGAQRDRCVASKRPQDSCRRTFDACIEVTKRPTPVPVPAPQPKPDEAGDAPAAVRVGVGRMVLVFQTPAGRETWEAWISFDGSKPPAATPQN